MQVEMKQQLSNISNQVSIESHTDTKSNRQGSVSFPKKPKKRMVVAEEKTKDRNEN